MASFSGHLHRPLSAMAVAAMAAVSSSELPGRFSLHRPADVDVAASLPAELDVPESCGSRGSAPGVSGLSFLPWGKPRADGRCSAWSKGLLSAPFASLPVIQTVYQYAKFVKPSDSEGAMPAFTSSTSDVLYRWHLPDPKVSGASGKDGCSLAKSQTVVVLLGWLGARQKHLKRYADWYTSRGFHVVTFTLPMSDIVNYNVMGKAEKNLEMLAEHLGGWVGEENGKKIVFHTFSNTGWLCYGVILENFRTKDPSAMEKIKGCIVDSAPVAAPDPQVWASGFSAAILKKHSVATKGLESNVSRSDMLVLADSGTDPKPAATEAVLLTMLEKFFDFVLNYPTINRRLSDVLELLSSKQPRCPQLYIYSSADRVIPATSVESFIDGQRRAGHEVRACDFVSSPHVDHYRSHPGLYTSQLANFFNDCVLAPCKDSPS